MTSAFNTRNRVIEVIRRGQRGLDGDVGLTTTVDKGTTFTAINGERGYVYRATSAITINFEQVTTLTNGWHVIVDAVGGEVTLDPNGAETINGLATLAVPQNASALVYSDGTALYARFFYGSAAALLNGLPTAADKYIYGTALGVWAEGDITSGARNLLADPVTVAGRALLDDADALAQRATLGLTEAIVTTALASQAEAEAGTNNTNLVTPLRTKQAIDAFSPSVFRSTSAGSLAVSTNYTFTHGLGDFPDWFHIYAICTTADFGWAVDDRIYLMDSGNTGGATSGIGIHQPDNTQIILSTGPTLIVYLVDPNNTRRYLTAGRWNVYCNAGLFA